MLNRVFLQTGDTLSHVGTYFFSAPTLLIIAPLAYSLVHLPPPSSLPKVKVQNLQTVCGWEMVGGGVLSCVGDDILREFN